MAKNPPPPPPPSDDDAFKAITAAMDFSEVRVGAIAMKEMFDELTAVGFTERQALAIVVGLARPEPEDGEES